MFAGYFIEFATPASAQPVIESDLYNTSWSLWRTILFFDSLIPCMLPIASQPPLY